MHEARPKMYLFRYGETRRILSTHPIGRTDDLLTELGGQGVRAVELALCIPPALCGDAPGCSGSRRRTWTPLGRIGIAVRMRGGAPQIQTERRGWRLFRNAGRRSRRGNRCRSDRVVEHVRRASINTLVFAHRDIRRLLGARRIGLVPANGVCPARGDVSILAYHHLWTRR